ncbi:MAG: hypothetical protein ACRD1T_20495, partial [Acidimicrobiia bacterium]
MADIGDHHAIVQVRTSPPPAQIFLTKVLGPPLDLRADLLSQGFFPNTLSAHSLHRSNSRLTHPASRATVRAWI